MDVLQATGQVNIPDCLTPWLLSPITLHRLVGKESKSGPAWNPAAAQDGPTPARKELRRPSTSRQGPGLTHRLLSILEDFAGLFIRTHLFHTFSFQIALLHLFKKRVCPWNPRQDIVGAFPVNKHWQTEKGEGEGTSPVPRCPLARAFAQAFLPAWFILPW